MLTGLPVAEGAVLAFVVVVIAAAAALSRK